MYGGSSQDITYRVPLSTWPLPEPEIKWKAEREAFARGETVEAQLTSGWAPDTWIPLDANFEGDWNALFAARIKPWSLLQNRVIGELLPDMPRIGVGGIRSGRDVDDYRLTGVSGVAIGTEFFRSMDPRIFVRVLEEVVAHA
jgi:hypothetical protein